MTIIDALKRLERAGSEESKATGKLLAAAREVSDYVIGLLPNHVQNECDRQEGNFLNLRVTRLPGGYVLDWNAEGTGHALGILYGNGEWERVYDDRKAALHFAEQIADGWLDEVAAWLEERAAKAAAAATVLENARQ